MNWVKQGKNQWALLKDGQPWAIVKRGPFRLFQRREYQVTTPAGTLLARENRFYAAFSYAQNLLMGEMR